jgi:Cystatin domain
MKSFASSLILVSFAFAQPIAGGWGKANLKNPQVLEAARFAVAAQQSRTDSVFKLLAITRAEQQVVAGMNYRFCLHLQGGKAKTAWVQVYQDLQGQFKLTGWTWGCQA